MRREYPVPEYPPSQISTVKVLRWINLVASLVISIYWGWTFSGLYAWLARFQLWAFGGYVDILSWILAWGAVLLSLHIVIGGIALRAGLPFDRVPLDNGQTALRINKFVFQHFGSVVGGLVIAGGILSGGYFLIDGYRAGTLSELPVEKLYAGEEPASRYVDLMGQPLRSEEYTVGILGSALSRSGPGPDYYYFPMVPGGWRPEDEVHVVVRSFYETADLDYGAAGHPNRLRGILRNRVPGLPLNRLQGRIKVADDAWLLDETVDPDFDRQLGLWLMGGLSAAGMFVLLLANGLARFGRQRISAKPREHVPPPSATYAPLGSFLKQRYLRAGLFAIPIIVASILIGVLGNVLERSKLLSSGQIDALMIGLMWLLVIIVGYVMLTSRKLGGPFGRWQEEFRSIPTFMIRWFGKRKR